MLSTSTEMHRVVVLSLVIFVCSSAGAELFAQPPTVNISQYLDSAGSEIKNSPGQTYNWTSLDPYLKNRELILIGEFNHGSGNVFSVRNDLIRHLHETHDVNVVLFESGIGELAAINRQSANMSPAQLINGFFGGWRTNEFRELMTYLQKEKMQFGGFDVQRFGDAFLPLFLETGQKYDMDTLALVDIEARFGNMKGLITNNKSSLDTLRQVTSALISAYKELLETFPPQSGNSKELSLVRRTLQNRIAYLSYMLNFREDQDWDRRWNARDSEMATNVEFLSENIFPGQKIALIGHNFHIARYNEKEEVMGEHLSPVYQQRMFSIGIFAAGGTYFNNAGEAEQMILPEVGKRDIKHIILQRPGDLNFLPMPSQKTQINNWLFEPMIVNDTFIDLYGSNEMVLPRHFDALLLFRSVSPPIK